jgi:hypothetical protein
LFGGYRRKNIGRPFDTFYLVTSLKSLNLDNISDSEKVNILLTRFSIVEEIGVIYGLLLSAKADNYKVQFVSGAW